MAASVQFVHQSRDLGMAMREVDEDLAIFLGWRNGHTLIEDFDDLMSRGAEPKFDTSFIPKGSEAEIVADDNVLNLEIDDQSSKYDWLTPEKINVPDSASIHNSISTDVANSCANSKASLSRDRKAISRAPTPTRRPSLPAKSKPSCASKPTPEPPRASLRVTPTSSKPVGALSRSSTPSRSTISKSGSRSATPTRKSETTQSSVSSSDKSRKTSLKNPQIVKSRPSKPSEILSSSEDAPQNNKTSMPKRPASTSRGRQSTQDTNVRASQGTTGQRIGGVMLSRSRSYSHKGGDDVNPVLRGTKMVERVVNMRKLAPPKQDERVFLDNLKKASVETLGFGRSLSKRSLDMAIRHMDIRRSIQDNLHPVATPVSSSFASGNQCSSSQSSTVGFSDSPLTSASDSSKSSNCANSYFLPGGEWMTNSI